MLLTTYFYLFIGFKNNNSTHTDKFKKNYEKHALPLFCGSMALYSVYSQINIELILIILII